MDLQLIRHPQNNNNNNNNNEYLWSAPSSTLGGSARRFTEKNPNQAKQKNNNKNNNTRARTHTHTHTDTHTQQQKQRQLIIQKGLINVKKQKQMYLYFITMCL